MPNKTTIEKARRAKRAGKAPTTQAGAFVAEEMQHVRRGKHGARSPKQVIAIGLSKARRAGVKLPAPKKGTTSSTTRVRAERDVAARQGKKPTRKVTPKRRAASTRALKREGTSAASPRALSHPARGAAAARKRRVATTTKPASKTSTSTRKPRGLSSSRRARASSRV
jgi:hypothetical protein